MIIKYLLLKIQAGDFLVGDKIPSEEALAIKFNCNRHTARSALAPLRNLGVIALIPGKGNILKYSLMELHSTHINVRHNKVKINKIEMEKLPLSLLKYYHDGYSCFQETYYFNDKIIALAYLILFIPNIKEQSYQQLFKLFSYYGIVIKKIDTKIKMLNNQGHYLEIKNQTLMNSNTFFYSDSKKLISTSLLFCDPNFFSQNFISKIF